ncbi:MAG: NAD-binding protein [Holosporaceae bacterium]|jgi:trk system potassium uptake protein TrkA|nr:NAD-binding protein [Holosporaceae bacterium]
MNVLILGGGQVGFGVAHYLKNQGFNVTVIEQSPELAFKIGSSSDVTVVQGNALDVNVIRNANAEDSSHLIATMSCDEQNMTACRLLGSMFNIKTKIARIRSDFFLKDSAFELFLKDCFGIDALIHPELEVATYTSHIVSLKGAFDVVRLNLVTIICLKCRENTEILNTPLTHFQSVTNLTLFILTITRNGAMFFPSSQDILLPGDEIYIAIESSQVDAAMTLFGYPQEKQNLLVVGGGITGGFIVKNMDIGRNISITWLEKSKNRAEAIAQNYPDATVILGDALSGDLLREIGSDANTAIVATDHDETNVLASLFLKKFGTERTLSLVKNRNYDPLLSANGCIVVDPGAITIGAILKKSCLMKISSWALLRDSSVCVAEVEITKSCSVLNGTTESVNIDSRIIFVFIIRNDRIMLVKKNVSLKLGDRVILLTSIENMPFLKKTFPNFFR